MADGEIGDFQFARELVSFFGARRATYVMGMCALLAAFGVKTSADVATAPVGSRSARYALLASLREFRAHLVAEGYALGPEDDLAVVLEGLRAA